MGNAEHEADARRALLNKMGRDWNAFNNHVVGFPIPEKPELLSEDRATFRAGFMQEELDEFRKANHAGDLDGSVDACIDLLYVTMGALGEMGVLVQPTWDEVQRANMAKMRGGLSKRPGSKGFDAVKPEGWKPPSHADYLTITSQDVDAVLTARKGFANLLRFGDQTYCREPSSGGWRVLSDEELDTIDALRNGEARVVPVSPPTGASLSIWPKDAKIIVMGHAGHGKDTVCELLRDEYGLKFTSSSLFCSERVVWPYLQAKYKAQTIFSPVDYPIYEDATQAFKDRSNHRKMWYDLITTYNTPDKSRLSREILAENSVYCGLRNASEFHALKNAGLFHLAIWVDAADRCPPEPRSSCTVEPWMADFVLDNNGSLEDLKRNLAVLMRSTAVED